jgi:CheY-like chemotaxis protein
MFATMLDHVPILLAEDDPNDAALMRRAFESAGFPNPLYIVHNGQEVVDYLEGSGEFSQRDRHPLPGIVVLDLKMPLMDGFDVLAWLRAHSQFDTLPVVVLTASKLEEDINKSRELGVYDYRVKPQAFTDLVRLLDDVRQCWLDEQFNHFAPAHSAN